MPKINKKQIALKLPKNIGAIQISNDLTLVERKIMNVILWNALCAEQKNLTLHHKNKKYYKITLAEISEYIGWDNSHNISTIKDSMKKLVETSLQFNIFEVQKTNDGKWNVITSLLSGAIFQDSGQEILYCFSDIIKDIILKPTLYATLDLCLQQDINSKYTLALWEYLAGELALKNHKCTTEYLTIDDYVKLIAGSQTKYTEFRKINEKLIKNPSKELIQKTDIQLEPEYLKEGRKVVAIRFGLQTNQKTVTIKQVETNTDHEDLVCHNNQQNHDIYNMCKDIGISEVQCKKYSKLHTLDYIKSNIDYIKKVYQNRKNPALYRKAIEENYAGYKVKKAQEQQSLDLPDNKKTEYLELVKSVEPEFEDHLKRTLMGYFSHIHHDWIQCLNIQSHTKGNMVISLLNTQQINTIERNKKKFDDVFHREYQNTFNLEAGYEFVSFAL